MNIGVVGLGLIGGSLAKAYKRSKDVTVYGYDIDRSIMGIAKISGAVDDELNEKTIKKCDCILIALYTDHACRYLEENSPLFSRDTVVIDCCGTKRKICTMGFALAEKYGFTFVGGHPMAGTHESGFRNSKAELFDGACMVIVPETFDDITLLAAVSKLLSPLRLSKISVTTAKKHDEIIAYTSQLAHIVSNAYIKSPTATEHAGFSAGSYKDMTRVARLNPDMWAQLFCENSDNLVNELDILIDNMIKYRDTLKNDNPQELCRLLSEGNDIKEKVDG